MGKKDGSPHGTNYTPCSLLVRYFDVSYLIRDWFWQDTVHSKKNGSGRFIFMLIDMFLIDIDIIITEQRYERSVVERELPPLVRFFLYESAPPNAYPSFVTSSALSPRASSFVIIKSKRYYKKLQVGIS